MQVKKCKRCLTWPRSGRIVHYDLFSPFWVQQIFVGFDFLRFDNFRIDEKCSSLRRRHHQETLSWIQKLDSSAAPLLRVFHLWQNERRLDRIQHPRGQKRDQTCGRACDGHIPEILPGASLGGKPRTDTCSSVREVLNCDTVFLLKRFN